jgi:hypothetical protein
MADADYRYTQEHHDNKIERDLLGKKLPISLTYLTSSHTDVVSLPVNKY